MDVPCTSKLCIAVRVLQRKVLTSVSEAGCKGNSTYIEKNNSNILGPGPVDLEDVGFDKIASAFQCF
jgi:hypothetical protein